MKKNVLTILALAAMVCPLVACGQTTTSSSAASTSKTPTTVEDFAELACNMLNFDSQAAKGMSSRYFDAPGEIKYNDTYTFNVSYTAVQQTVYEGASITISQDNDPDLLTHPARVTIVSPIKDPANTAKWIVFVMTAHLSYQNKEVYSRDFNLRADPVSVVKISAVGGQDSGAAVMLYGKYIGKYDKSSDYYWIGDGTAGITAYAPVIQSGYTPAVGDYVRVIGAFSPYSGLLEIGKGCSLEKASDTDVFFHKTEILDPVETVWDGSVALQDYQESLPIKLTGVVGTPKAGSAPDSSGNYTWPVTVGTRSINVYIKKSSDATDHVTKAAAVKVGDNVTVEGILGCYGTYQVINAVMTVNS